VARTIVVAGVGLIPLRQTADHAGYAAMGAQAVRLALADARAGYESVQQAFASYGGGDSCAGQRVLYDIGLTGIPIVNLRSDGASALWLARQAIVAGEAEIVLALGFEPAPAGAGRVGGAAAAVLCSEGYARRHGLDTRVRIDGVELVDRAPTDEPLGYEGLAQCHQQVQQLRGQPAWRVAGAAAVVTLYRN